MSNPSDAEEPAGAADPAAQSEPLLDAIRPHLKDSGREEAEGLLRATLLHASYSGPMPHPDLLERYNQVIPNGAERLLEMARREQAHRIAWEVEALRYEGRAMMLGLNFGAIVAGSLVVGAVVCAFLGETGIGLAMVGASAFGLVARFLESRWLARRGK